MAVGDTSESLLAQSRRQSQSQSSIDVRGGNNIITFRSRMARMRAEHNYGVGDGGLRAAVFGFCDGLLSNCCLVLGVYSAFARGDTTVTMLLLTALAGLVAGAASMASGEWISMTAQEEAEQKELLTERRHITEDYDLEAEELAEYLQQHGVSEAVAALVTEDIKGSPHPVDDMLNMHARIELGIDPEEAGGSAPMKAAIFSFCTFAAGAFIPLLPWLVVFVLERMHSKVNLGHVIPFAMTTGLSGLALFGAGALLAGYTGRSKIWSGFRQLLVGVIAATLCLSVGSLFGSAVA